MTSIPLPSLFVDRMKSELGPEYPDFEESLNSVPPLSIRFNPSKRINTQYLPFQNKVLWCPEGVYLQTRPQFTLDPNFHAGAYYVQEASSMILWSALKQLIDLNKPIKALDLCAAPGGKTSLLASILHKNSIIVGNETIKSRVGMLEENMTKWGCSNRILTNADPEQFKALRGSFDLVLVDAPCSGEGLFRKDPRAINQWSENNLKLCELRQKRILESATELVSPGGILIFSTCTFNPLENEGCAKYLCDNFQLQELELKFDPVWQIRKKDKGYQMYPHRSKGEGFYFAVFRSENDTVTKAGTANPGPKLSQNELSILNSWVSAREEYRYFIDDRGSVIEILEDHVEFISKMYAVLNKRCRFFDIGVFKSVHFIPSHALILSNRLSEEINKYELEVMEALHYLKKESVAINSTHKSWIRICYKGLDLGWAKIVQGRANNYLPKQWRIRMDIDN